MLFKYRNLYTSLGKEKCLCERTMELIEHGSVYIPSHEELNDPYERLVHIVPYKAFTEEEEISKRQEIKNAYKADSEMGEVLECLYKDTHEIVNMHNKFRCEELDFYSSGIYSLSEKNNSIIMWSHYGQNHEGICIGFDMSALKETKNLVKVKYVKTPPKELGTTKRRYPEQYFYKHKYYQWSYEKEWRLILPFQSSQCIDFPAKIKAIYFGAKVDDELLRECIERIPDGIELYRFNLCNEEFTLLPELIKR